MAVAELTWDEAEKLNDLICDYADMMLQSVPQSVSLGQMMCASAVVAATLIHDARLDLERRGMDGPDPERLVLNLIKNRLKRLKQMETEEPSNGH